MNAGLPIRRRILARLAAASLGLAGLGCSDLAAPAPHPGPHLLLISADTLRADRVGLYGYSGDTTPHLDRAFSEGTVVERAWSAAPCTLPSVPQLLLGRYDTTRGNTLAEKLADAGYSTAAVVSQHHFRPDSDKPLHKQAMVRAVRRGFADFDAQAAQAVDRHGMSDRRAAEVTDRALRWLDERPPERPFFLWLHYFDPHDPYAPPADAPRRARRGGRTGNGDRRTLLMQGRSDPRERWQTVGRIFTSEEQQQLRDLYDDEIRYLDGELGRLFEGVERAGLWEQSLVVFTSDHGEWLGEGGRWDHCQTPAPEEVQVPLLLRWRGGPLPGTPRVSGPASLLDVAPTVLGLLAPQHAAGHDGSDLRLPRTGPVFAAWEGATAVARGPWTLLVGRDERLLRDGREVADPSAGEAAAVARELGAAATRFESENSGLYRQNRRVLERLRRLGYVD